MMKNNGISDLHVGGSILMATCLFSLVAICLFSNPEVHAQSEIDSDLPNITGLQNSGIDKLTEDERDSIKKRMETTFATPFQLGEQLVNEYVNRPLISYMIELINDTENSDRIFTYSVSTLAMSEDPRGLQVLRAIIDEPLKQNMSRKEWARLHAAILCIGRLADDKTLDLLAEMATESYWIKRNSQACEKNESPKDFRRHMRLMALDAFAASGSERAVNMFKNKKDIPEDMLGECEWLENSANRHHEKRMNKSQNGKAQNK